MSETISMPRWFVVSVMAPLVVASVLGGFATVGAFIRMDAALGYVRELVDKAATEEYVDSQHQQNAGKIKFVRYRVNKLEDHVESNDARIQDLRERSLGSDAVWRPPMMRAPDRLLFASAGH